MVYRLQDELREPNDYYSRQHPFQVCGLFTYCMLYYAQTARFVQDFWDRARRNQLARNQKIEEERTKGVGDVLKKGYHSTATSFPSRLVTRPFNPLKPIPPMARSRRLASCQYHLSQIYFAARRTRIV
ncbi:hypothetical protein BT69DRAFT_1280261 [Atractiella rhizophila]|nr:hypothetical protein BT69DRAFT_1280261 [Atractiella rhizophila]